MKDLLKSKSLNLSNNYPVSKQVSLWVKVLGFLFIPLCLSVIVQLLPLHQSDIAAVELNEKIEMVHENLDRKLANIETYLDGVNSKIHRENRSQKKLLGINKKLHEQDVKNQKIIEDQKLKIYNLEKIVADLQYQLRQTQKTKKVHTKKTIPFNDVNRDILAFEHREKEKALKRQHKLELEAFIKSHDLDRVEYKDKLEKLKHSQKIELFTLRRNNEEVRRRFRKRQYHNIAMD